MGVPQEYALTDEDITRLKAMVKKPGQHTFIEQDCASARKQFRNGVRKKTLEEELDVNDTTIRRHLSGDCGCDVDEPPLEHTQSGHYRRLYCWEPECNYSISQYNSLTDHWHAHHKGDRE